MASEETNLSSPEGKVVGASVPTNLAEFIREDAKAEERSSSHIIRRILERHYAKRLKARTQPRRAA